MHFENVYYCNIMRSNFQKTSTGHKCVCGMNFCYKIVLLYHRKLLSIRRHKKKVREKSRECHNHKPQPFPDPKKKRKPTNRTNVRKALRLALSSQCPGYCKGTKYALLIGTSCLSIEMFGILDNLSQVNIGIY